MRALLFLFLASFLFLGCSTKTIVKEQEVTSVKREVPMWGIQIGCERKDVKNGFTKKGCIKAGLGWGK